MTDLALFGGKPIRNEPFMSRPHIDENERKYISDCLDKGSFSRFIGSPVPNFREYLSMNSQDAMELNDFWSVLGGEYVRLFEFEFARKHDATYAVSMNSATSALTAALIACGVQKGDEVITTPFTFTATGTAITLMGAHAKFADINPQTFCMDVSSLKKMVTDRTKAVIPVHILGNAGNILDIRGFCEKRGLSLIEDSAQALHARKEGVFLGNIGDIGVFSFQETKNIMTGEGGIAITDDPEFAYRLRLIRNHGESMVFESDPPERIRAALGYNFRLPEIVAALGYAQVQKIEFLNDIRKQNYEYLKRELSNFDFLEFQVITNDPDEYYPYCVGLRLDAQKFGIDRDLFAQALRAEGVPVSTGFPRLLNENLVYNESSIETPIAHKLNYESYLGFFQVGYPNKEEDMEDILSGVEKLFQHREDLVRKKKSDSGSREYHSGRL